MCAAKGGVGKTTVSIHIAAALSDHAPAVLIDLDEANASAIDYGARGHLPYPVMTAADFEAARPAARYVIADAYPRPTDAQLAQLAANTRARGGVFIIPTAVDGVSLRVLARFLPRVAALGVPYRVLVAQVPPYPSKAGARALRDLTAGRVPVFTTVIPRAAAFINAARACRLAWSVPGGRRLEHTFDQLAREAIEYANT